MEELGEKLIFEAISGNLEKVSQLLARGVYVDFSNRLGVTPLMVACQWGRSEVVKLLLHKGAAVEARETSSGANVLMYACLSGHFDLVRLVVEKGASVDSTDNSGRTALMTAASIGKASIVELLLNKGADVNAEDKLGDTALDFAVARGYSEVAELLLSEGATGKGLRSGHSIRGDELSSSAQWKTP
jgi:uncharacterized protein